MAFQIRELRPAYARIDVCNELLAENLSELESGLSAGTQPAGNVCYRRVSDCYGATVHRLRRQFILDFRQLFGRCQCDYHVHEFHAVDGSEDVGAGS